MATADTTVEISTPAPTGLEATFPALQTFNQLPPRQKMGMAAALALMVALVIGTWLWSRQPDYAVLFSNLSDKDGGSITAALTAQQVPYKFSEGGGAILVPSGMVHDVRLRLASQGLPKGGLVGFEIMENQKLGISQFAEQVNYQRALEGELARSVQSLAAVESARVHLAIPKQSGFLRDEQKPTASILVSLYAGRTLEPAQVAGVVHLVASSVPQLNQENVSIIDQNGNLLAPRNDPLRAAGLDPTQLKYVQELEKSYIKRIEDILTPIVGAKNFRAQATADVDFNQTEQTAESWRPSSDANRPNIRSQQTSESTSNQTGNGGVPGALTNQPPAPATAPINAPTAGPGSATSGSPLNARKDATVNYELDKTIRHVKQALGTVKRLSVAVVVNHKTDVLPNGKSKTTPLSEAEMQQINALVKEAMGYSQERGDTVNVANSPFAVLEKEVVPDVPFWKNPDNIPLLKEGGRWLMLAVLVGYLIFGVIRPMVKRLTYNEEKEKAEAEAEAEALAEAAHLEGQPEGSAGALGHEATAGELESPEDAFAKKLQAVRDMAAGNPKLVANLIKEWVEGGNG